MTSPGSPGKPNDPSDRRTHDRVYARLSLEADHDGRRVQITAMNLSEGGAYCLSEFPFPLMTRLEVSLEVPSEGSDPSDSTLRLPAVVVRCEPHPTVGANWNLALFFANPSPSARARLSSFIRERAQGAPKTAPGSNSSDC